MGNKNITLKPETMVDLLDCTEYNEKELKEFYVAYIKGSPSGLTTIEDFEKIYNSVFPNGDASKFAEHVFRTFDANEDGKIDFKEVMCGLSVTSRGTFDQKLRWAFSMYDIDGDGYISREEMLIIIKSIYKMVGAVIEADETSITPETRTDFIFKALDRDADGKVSLEEFTNGARQDRMIIRLLQCNSLD